LALFFGLSGIVCKIGPKNKKKKEKKKKKKEGFMMMIRRRKQTEGSSPH
jgi:hypothetical protein